MTTLKTLLVLMCFSTSAWAQTQAAAPAPAPGNEKALSEAYSILAADKFLNPGSQKLTTILGITKLNGLAHPADFSKADPKAHPALPFISFDPMKVLSKAETDYRKGDTAKTAYSVRRVMQLCSECHAHVGKPVWTALSPTPGLTLVERGEFYKLAVRYDDALLQYEKVMNAPGLAASQPQIWERAVMNIVALGIESSSNAYTFVDLVSNALQVTPMSKSQRALLASWRITGKAWGAEKSAVTKPFDMLTQVRQFMTTADTMNRKLPGSGFVHQARAMLTLKRVMMVGGPEQKARAFLMAGELREKIPLEGVYLHAEDYYEACARVAPKGGDAPKCITALQNLPRRSKYVADYDLLKSLGAR